MPTSYLSFSNLRSQIFKFRISTSRSASPLPFSNLQSQISKFCLLSSVFCLLFATSCHRKPAAPVEPGPPPTVSSFILQNLASEFPGEIHTTNFADKVQLVIFFRSDDAACRGALPAWTGLQNEFEARGFTLVGAVVEDDRHPDAIFAEVSALEISWPIGLANTPIVDAFGGPTAIRAIPTAFLIGRDGLVARHYAGFEPIQNLREDIDHLLNDQALPNRNPTVIAPEDNAA